MHHATETTDRDITLRAPSATDGAPVYRLIERCPPLDTNSRYCNLLQCTHFASTCVLAERDHDVVGFVSGYVTPGRDDTLFVWQVAVAPEARHRGLAQRMLEEILAREACKAVRYVETSITPDNDPSWRTFRAFARSMSAAIVTEPWLSRRTHFERLHPPEHLVRIGPFDRQSTPQQEEHNR